MHPLQPVSENSPLVSGHSQNTKFVIDIEPDQAVQRSGAGLSQEGSWPNGPPPPGPKRKHRYGASTAAVASAGRGSAPEAEPWTPHTFGTSLQLQRAKEPSHSPKRRRLSDDHYSPPKLPSATAVRPHIRTQHDDEEHEMAHEIHRRSPPPRGRLIDFRTSFSSDRGSWRPERSYELRTSPVRSTPTKLPRSPAVLADYTLNREQETKLSSEGFIRIAKSKRTRDKLPDSDLVGSQTCLPLEGVNEVAKTNSAEVSDTRTVLIPSLVDRRQSTTGSPPEHTEPNESLRSPQIGSIEGNPFNTSVLNANSPDLRFGTASKGSKSPMSCISASTTLSTPLTALSAAGRAAGRAAVHRGAERASFTHRASAQPQLFAGLPKDRKEVASEGRASSGTRTPSPEPAVLALLIKQAGSDPKLAELLRLVTQKEATSEEKTILDDLLVSLRDKVEMEGGLGLETSTWESVLNLEVEEGMSEKPPLIPKSKNTENHSLPVSTSSAVPGASLRLPELQILQYQPSTRIPSSVPRATTKRPREPACKSCRKKKQCKHPISTTVKQNNAQGCEECEWKQVFCFHRELLISSEIDNSISTTSDYEESTYLPPANSDQVNRDSHGQSGGPADGLEAELNDDTLAESLQFEDDHAEDLSLNLNSKRMGFREKRVVQETQPFEDGSSVALRRFKAAKSNTSRQNAPSLFFGRNKRESGTDGPYFIPECLGCGKLVVGKSLCINCESIYKNTYKNTTVTPQTPEATASGPSNPERSTMSVTESPTPSINPTQPGPQSQSTSRVSSVSTRAQSLVPRKRKHEESRPSSGHSNQPLERTDCPPYDALNHLSAEFASINKVESLKRSRSKEDAEAQRSSLKHLPRMQAKDTGEVERLLRENFHLQEKLRGKQKQADELEQVKNERASKLSDEPDSSTDITIEPHAYDHSKYPPPKPYVPAYRRPRVSTNLYEIAPHLHPDIVFFDKEARIREIEARPSRKATFGKVLARSRR